ncbi:2'-5' RNA ligase [Halobacillus dabanensis]|uniref:2'-5' RNA ligase n=1 Tax=Halobacillus dabanensis TaxID=240302 RepID=A0A1I3TGX6_HALDA|nr:2'-5' RNA ligase family protein [Halobacillus dabanensis]SFJ69792.1 2'-5' RNA ligase [Halobacillus dabanensis]
MRFFIGIVPPKDYKQRVIDFQNQWKFHEKQTVVEPHITLKAQSGLTPDQNWMSKVERICNTSSPFTIMLGEPSFFGEDVLYLSMKSSKLEAIHARIVKAIGPAPHLLKKYFELDDYVPHMTLAKTSYGISGQELREMEKAATKLLSPYPSFDVHFIRVFKEAGPNKYEKLVDLPLGS